MAADRTCCPGARRLPDPTADFLYVGSDRWRELAPYRSRNLPLRSAMFAAQAIARDMEAAGRGDEIADIARNISRVAPELPPETCNSENASPLSRDDGA